MPPGNKPQRGEMWDPLKIVQNLVETLVETEKEEFFFLTFFGKSSMILSLIAIVYDRTIQLKGNFGGDQFRRR